MNQGGMPEQLQQGKNFENGILKLSFLSQKNLIVSSFLVLSNRRLQNHKLAKVEYV